MKRIITVILFLAIIFASIGAVSSQNNLTDENCEVEPLTETLNVSGSDFKDIQNAADTTEANSTIILNGTYNGNGKEIEISKDLTIEGTGKTTLDAHSSSRIFNILSGSVVIKNINFINAKSTENGGAIASNGKLTVINCNFTDNRVSYEPQDSYPITSQEDYEKVGCGGAIYANYDLTLINSTFIRNSATFWMWYSEMGSYYPMHEDEGGAVKCKGKLHLENSTFSANSAPSVVCANSQIIGCIFKNQSNSFLIEGTSNATFINCLFSNCGAENIQSEIATRYEAEAKVFIDRCNFTNNHNGLVRIYPYGKVSISNSLFENNTFTYSNTARSLIEIDDYADISNTTFKNNRNRDTAILDVNKYDLSNCTFENNLDAAILSKGILLDDNMNRIYIFEAKIANKQSKVYYGSGKVISIKVINKISKEINPFWDLKIYRNGKAFYDYWLDDTCVLPVSTWKAGTYKITVKTDSQTKPDELDFKVTILKAKTTVKAPKITAKYKKSKYFKITVKSNKKIVKNLKLKVKVYTGKKYKIYNLKTNKKGIAALNTKKLKIGKHRIIITSGNSNYQVSAKSFITIRK